MMHRRMEPEFCHADARGSLAQLASKGCAQVNILRTRAGVTRGGHCHKRCTEMFYVVSGSVHVTFSNGRESEEGTFHANDFFAVPPGIAHALRFPEDCVLVAIYDQPVETPEGKDIHDGGDLL